MNFVNPLISRAVTTAARVAQPAQPGTAASLGPPAFFGDGAFPLRALMALRRRAQGRPVLPQGTLPAEAPAEAGPWGVPLARLMQAATPLVQSAAANASPGQAPVGGYASQGIINPNPPRLEDLTPENQARVAQIEALLKEGNLQRAEGYAAPPDVIWENPQAPRVLTPENQARVAQMKTLLESGATTAPEGGPSGVALSALMQRLGPAVQAALGGIVRPREDSAVPQPTLGPPNPVTWADIEAARINNARPRPTTELRLPNGSVVQPVQLPPMPTAEAPAASAPGALYPGTPPLPRTLFLRGRPELTGQAAGPAAIPLSRLMGARRIPRPANVARGGVARRPFVAPPSAIA